MPSNLTSYLIIGLIAILSVLLVFTIIKSIIGPKVADRIVSVNMLSTIVIMILCAATVLFENESYLVDIPLVYVLISFVAVIVLSNVFINVNLRKKFKNTTEDKEAE